MKQSINLLLFLQKQNLATAIYLFGLGTLLIARESTLDKETALWARWGAHRERVEADA